MKTKRTGENNRRRILLAGGLLLAAISLFSTSLFSAPESSRNGFCKSKLASLHLELQELLRQWQNRDRLLPWYQSLVAGAWYSNLMPEGMGGKLQRGLGLITGRNPVDRILAGKGKRLYHGFIAQHRYGRELTEIDILRMMTETGHASAQLAREAKNQTGASFLDTPTDLRLEILGRIIESHIDSLDRSDFSQIQLHFIANNPGPYHFSPYLSSSTFREVAFDYSRIRGVDNLPEAGRGEYGYFLELTPSPLSAEVSKLENHTLHPKPPSFDSQITRDRSRPLYRFEVRSAHEEGEVLDPGLYLPEQILKVTVVDQNKKVVRTFEKDAQAHTITVRDVETGRITIHHYGQNSELKVP